MRRIRKYSTAIGWIVNFRRLALIVGLANALKAVASGQPPQASSDCLEAMRRCESSTDCIHRLAALQASCVTNTCQPQCRESAMNLYQNREGRQLLRTDASCVPGRYELEKCNLLPNRMPQHCSFAKLICESDLACNAKWEVFASECEAETADGRCSDKCRRHLAGTLATPAGAALETCNCTDKDDGRCVQLRDGSLNVCLRANNRTPLDSRPHAPRPTVSENDINAGEKNDDAVGVTVDDARAAAASVSAGGLLAFAGTTLLLAVARCGLLGL